MGHGFRNAFIVCSCIVALGAMGAFSVEEAQPETFKATGTSPRVFSGAVLEDFADYEPPAWLNTIRYDYMTSTGAPSEKPTEYPTWQLEYPHRAYFLGGNADGSRYQIIIVMSRTPILSDMFEFSYKGSKSGWGYLRAKFDPDFNREDVRMLYTVFGKTNWANGLNYETVSFTLMDSFSSVAGVFDFDFIYHPCCGDLNIPGLRNITECPYAYILTCADDHGNGGSSSGGSESSSGGSSGGGDGSSGGSSSGGGNGSSGGDGSSSGGNGSSGGGGSESSTNPWEEEGSYPWQDDKNVPDLGWETSVPDYTNNGEDGEGINGDDWELPEWQVPSKPFDTDNLNIPDFPVDLEYSAPGFPVDLEYSVPDFPVDLEYSVPDAYYGDNWSWPPPFPGFGGY